MKVICIRAEVALFCHKYECFLQVLRMVNVNDKVPRVPGALVNENVPFLENLLDNLPWTYSHVELELEMELNDKHSKHLNQEKSATWTTHNLEVYLHLVDGYGRYGIGICVLCGV